MYRIACYYRVSKYTGIEDESQSIKNQRILVHKYIDNDLEINECSRLNNLAEDYSVQEYIDDGYSGKNIDRPGLTKLLNNILLGKINMIIVKDFSRFSRDYLYMGEFLEYLITTTDIRFISINDNYDSRNNNVKTSIDEAFKHIVYDYYSVENSYKIKRGLDESRRRGKYIASKPLYGYKIINGKLIINEEESKIVKRIFESYDKGIKVNDIVENINSMLATSKNWNKNRVYRILREEQYTGVMIYGKKKVLDVASQSRIACNKEQWKIIDNHHEPIINKELYVRVRKKMEMSLGKLNGG